ncbi:MAG TPA: ABC transporter permease, partial [Kofleriaceae bacterium]|nr:ABC transporter permease [Kofleriaceae bacterium]
VVMLAHSAPARAAEELAHVPGVLHAEGQRVVPVRMRVGSRWRDVTLVGMPDEPELRHLMNDGERPVPLPPAGLVVTAKLAEVLDVHIGDEVAADVLEGDWATHRFVIAGTIHEAFGLFGYARREYLASALGEQPRVSQVLLRIDSLAAPTVRAYLKDVPAVIGVTSTEQMIANYRAQTGQSVLVMTLILAVSAAAIAIGIVYNNARIALSMRSRDLATLRVLGFSRREISNILLGELGLQVLVGIPLGLALGTLWAILLIAGFDQESMRFPLHIADRTYVAAAAIALVSGAVSALLVRRKLDRLDLIGVLKSSWE